MGSSGAGAAQGALNSNFANQQQTNSLIQQINGQFESPSMVNSNQNYVNAVQQMYDTQLQGQQQNASRNLNFALARNGQTGGSVAADQNASLQKSYVNGLLQASQAAQGAGQSLVSSQKAQQSALTGLATSGNSTGQIASTLAGLGSSGITQAGQQAGAQSLGDVFNSTAQFYTDEQNKAAARQAQNTPWGNPYGFNG